MRLWFLKYEASGNDFIIVDARFLQDEGDSLLSEFAKRYCSRNFGIGADGVLALLPPTSGEFDFQMRIFNADGSEAEVSGNGLRCLAQYIFDSELKKSDTIVFETRAGKRTAQRTESGIRVDMGTPEVRSRMVFEGLSGTEVSVGNPHIVFFSEKLDEDFTKVAPRLSKEKNVNVEFAKILKETEIRARVWERGVGETLACGTGAVAIFAAASEQNKIPEKKKIKVIFPGGDLHVDKVGDNVFIEGKANFVFSGYVNI